MKLLPACVICLYDREMRRARKLDDESEREAYIEEVRQILRYERLDNPPEYISRCMDVFEGAYHKGDPESLKPLKAHFNEMMMRLEPGLTERVEAAADPLLSALKLAQAGNYIDSVTMPELHDEELLELLESFEDWEVDEELYGALRDDLTRAERIVYTPDNCGEIVCDLIFLRQIRRHYPQVHIQVIVRGEEVMNDVTMFDAEQIGMTEEFDVIGNGTDILGTSLHMMTEESARMVREADVIIAKGQGNFETLHGSGLNIYYLLLCKCPYFSFRFKSVQLSSVFCHERIELARDEVEEGLA